MLVVGDAATGVHADACQRLLGDDDAGPRRRVLAFPAGAYAVDARLPPSAGGDTHVVTSSTTRTTAATAAGSDTRTVTELGDADLADVGVAMAEAVAGFDRRHGPLASTELRLGVEGLATALEREGECAVLSFLAVTTRMVERFDALGHAHLPVGRETYAARLLAPLFDAVAEVRVRDGRPQQRWHLRDCAVTSRWLPL